MLGHRLCCICYVFLAFQWLRIVFPVFLITLLLSSDLLGYDLCLHDFFLKFHALTALFLGGVVRNLYIFLIPMGWISFSF